MNEKLTKVEFIESYIKHGDGDYEWNDNHGELVRCKGCKHGYIGIDSNYIMCMKPYVGNGAESHMPEWFCADGEHK